MLTFYSFTIDVALQFVRGRSAKLTANCDQLRSRKVPHCPWQTFSCSCYGALLVRRQVLELAWRSIYLFLDVPRRNSPLEISAKALLTCLWNEAKGFTLVKSAYL